MTSTTLLLTCKIFLFQCQKQAKSSSRMGECSFGKGFGQTNPESEPEDGIEERVWKAIPRSIFVNLMKKYQVRPTLPARSYF